MTGEACLAPTVVPTSQPLFFICVHLRKTLKLFAFFSADHTSPAPFSPNRWSFWQRGSKRRHTLPIGTQCVPREYRIWLPIHQMRRAPNPLRLPDSPAVITGNIEHHSRPRWRVDINPTDPSGICATKRICPDRLIRIYIRRLTIVNPQSTLAPSAFCHPAS